MKQHITILATLILLFASTLTANTQDNTLQAARDAYNAADYAQAAQLYEQLATQGTSPQLYYNLGNTYYKLNQPARAILNYERALALQPNYADAKYNLELANAQIKDKIEPIETFFLVRWMQALRSALSSNAWAYLSITLFTLTLVLVLLYAFSKHQWMRKIAFFLSLFTLLFTIATFIFSYQQKQDSLQHDTAIVLAGSVTVKSSPDESGTQLFVIHEGTKVTIRSTLGQWVEIAIADGNVGWTQASNIEKI